MVQILVGTWKCTKTEKKLIILLFYTKTHDCELFYCTFYFTFETGMLNFQKVYMEITLMIENILYVFNSDMSEAIKINSGNLFIITRDKQIWYHLVS